MTEDDPDDELVRACAEASQAARAAFDELYRRHAAAVHALLRALFPGDEHAACDALQETFFRCYRALPSFEPGRPLRPWLLRIARNVALDARKKASFVHEAPGAGPEAVERAPDPAAEAGRREEVSLLRGAVERLPEAELAVFLLRHDQGLTYEQVAEALSCSVRTAKYRMKAALERLGREAERLGVVR